MRQEKVDLKERELAVCPKGFSCALVQLLLLPWLEFVTNALCLLSQIKVINGASSS